VQKKIAQGDARRSGFHRESARRVRSAGHLRGHFRGALYTEWQTARRNACRLNASEALLLLRRLVGVFLLEALDAAGGVDKFLLAGEERMAI